MINGAIQITNKLTRLSSHHQLPLTVDLGDKLYAIFVITSGMASHIQKVSRMKIYHNKEIKTPVYSICI